MGIRQFDTTTPAEAELAPARQATGPKAETAQGAHDNPFLRLALGHGGVVGALGHGGVLGARAQAAALRRASGANLARAGQALLQLQGQYGNRHVQRVMSHARQVADLVTAPVVQAKLVLGAANDRYEQEADRVAQGAVGQAASHGPAAQREAGEDEQAPLLRQPVVQQLRGAAGGAVDARVAQALQRARGGGQPLPTTLRSSMEQTLGAGFGGVRVHTGAQSDQLNRSLQSAAFTSGQDIFFRRGAYEPGSPRGLKLLAHELAHVVQQRQGPAIQRKIVDIDVNINEGAMPGPLGKKYGFDNQVVVKVDGNTDVNNVRLHRRVRMFRYQTNRKTGVQEGKQTHGRIQNIWDSNHVKVIAKNSDDLTEDGWTNPRWQDDGPGEKPGQATRVTRSGDRITISDKPGFPIEGRRGIIWQNPSQYEASFAFTAEELTDTPPSPHDHPKYGTRYVASSKMRIYENYYKNPAIFT
jgi:hypothetical protein